MHIHSSLWRSDIKKRSTTRPQKIKALFEMPPPTNKKGLQAFLGIINYLGKFSPGTADMCGPLHKLTSGKVTWAWNASYQSLFSRAKLLIKPDMCMNLYDDTKPLYLKTDASGVGLVAALLQNWNVQHARKTWCQTTPYCIP